DDDPATWWEVVDRTTGAVIPPSGWSADPVSGVVTIADADAFHEYTVSFLAYVIWDPVEMYNHLTNGWGDKEHEIPFDIRHPEAWEHVQRRLRDWLAEHPATDVVRFTTFFYQFSLVFDAAGREKFVDWFGYGATVSVPALEEFARVKGCRLRPEDFVDEGYYNSSFRVPTQRYLDYLDFTVELVARSAAELVRLTHEAGKEAMMFLGDQWIGVEPYSERFAGIGLDAVVGSVGDGTTLRMISDIPGVKYTEGRFLPYFFPDSFYEGADPGIEARANWLQARRAILRSPIDRMGYGGYLSLASRFPSFVDTVAWITQEFRELHHRIAGTRPHSGLRVAVLNAWGRLRSWQAFTVAHALYNKQAYSYYGVLEALSGMAVEVEFLSFDEVIAHGIDPAIDVVINAGARDTSFSGGERWRDPRLVTALRRYVAAGGGLIGVGEPTAAPFQGRYFQLADCLGVDREMSQSLSSDKYHDTPVGQHFITADVRDPIDFGEGMGDVYALGPDTQILEYSRGEVHLAAHPSGQGRAVYLAGLPYSAQNTRLLLRALYWAAGRESSLTTWFAENPACEVNAYPAAGVFSVANSSPEPQHTLV
ncbi:MAG: 1,3-beta-galactosyl-N-acetylhexosamine phosphorylase, partial [Propionibacteriaceae bacterium]|nr:1,3-beta-galactosyl-N-acetylhexosamine phosphorylase [Propionibacteriaceae bacterium]